MIEFVLIAQLLTEPEAPKTPAFSWEQPKPVKPPDFQTNEPPRSGSSKQIEEFERRIFEYPS